VYLQRVMNSAHSSSQRATINTLTGRFSVIKMVFRGCESVVDGRYPSSYREKILNFFYRFKQEPFFFFLVDTEQ